MSATMQPHHKVLLVCLLSCFAVCACGSRPGTPPYIAPTPEAASMEQQLVMLVNEYRAEQGLTPLAYDEALANIARAHSLDMIDRAFFAHESPRTGTLDDRLSAADYTFSAARENLALSPTALGAHTQLLESPGHHANIVALDVTHIGVGVVRKSTPPEAGLYVTQVFAQPLVVVRPSEVGPAFLGQNTAARSSLGLPPLQRVDILDDLATDLLGGLSDTPDQAELQTLGSAIDRFGKAQGLGGETLAISVQAVATLESLEQTAAGLEASATSFGLAVRQRDAGQGEGCLFVVVFSTR